VLGSGYVLGVGSIEGLQHLNAKACIAREEHRELGHQQVSGSLSGSRVAGSPAAA
jgi:hypothetical protein